MNGQEIRFTINHCLLMKYATTTLFVLLTSVISLSASYFGMYAGSYTLNASDFYDKGDTIFVVDDRNRATIWIGSYYDEADKKTATVSSDGSGQFRTDSGITIFFQINEDETVSLSANQGAFITTYDFRKRNPEIFEDLDLLTDTILTGVYSISGRVSDNGQSVNIRGDAMILPDGTYGIYIGASGYYAMIVTNIFYTEQGNIDLSTFEITNLESGKLKLEFSGESEGVTIDFTMTQRTSYFDYDSDGLVSYVEDYYGTVDYEEDSDNNDVDDVVEALMTELRLVELGEDFLPLEPVENEDVEANTPRLGLYEYKVDEYFFITIVPTSLDEAKVFVTEDVSELYDYFGIAEETINELGLYTVDGYIHYSLDIEWDENGLIEGTTNFGDTMYGMFSQNGEMYTFSSFGAGEFYAYDVLSFGTGLDATLGLYYDYTQPIVDPIVDSAPNYEAGLYSGRISIDNARKDAYLILDGFGTYRFYYELDGESFVYSTGDYHLVSDESSTAAPAFAFSGDGMLDGLILEVENLYDSSEKTKLSVRESTASAKSSSFEGDSGPSISLTLERDQDLYDSDGDGVSDHLEINEFGSDPYDADTDGDKFDDGEELQAGTSMTDKDDTPAKIDITVSLASGIEVPESGSDLVDVYVDGNYFTSISLNGKKSTKQSVFLPKGSTYEISVEMGELTGGTPVTISLTKNTSAKFTLDGDGDNDGLLDSQESKNKGDPNNPDTDGDGILDGEEVQLRTRVDRADTDGDGLTDGDEINLYGTDPRSSDTDKDKQSDGAEIEAGTDPLDRTFFPASITVEVSFAKGATPPEGEDLILTINGEEQVLTLDSKNRVKKTFSFPTGVDYTLSIAMGILTGGTPTTISLTKNTTAKFTLDGDSDNDGLLDSQESKNKGDPNNPDTDGDGILDGEEVQLRTRVDRADTDGDGYTDKEELDFGTDARKRSDFPDAYAEQELVVDLTLFYYDEEGNPQSEQIDTATLCEWLAVLARVDDQDGKLYARSTFASGAFHDVWYIGTAEGLEEAPVIFDLFSVGDELESNIVNNVITRGSSSLLLSLVADGNYKYEYQEHNEVLVKVMLEQTTPSNVTGTFRHPDYTSDNEWGILRGSITFKGDTVVFPED